MRDTSKITGREIFTYGGDYGRYPASDYNFNCNGIIAPDRRLNPHAYEVQYYYQNIWVTDKGLKDGCFEVYNENFFKTLDDVALMIFVSATKVNDNLSRPDDSADYIYVPLDVKPQERKTMVLTELSDKIGLVLNKYPEEEVFVEFYFFEKQNQDELVARQQFVVQPYQFPTIEATGTIESKEETNTYIKLTAGGTTMTIGKRDGWIHPSSGVPRLITTMEPGCNSASGCGDSRRRSSPVVL